jgi:hypothetical protein
VFISDLLSTLGITVWVFYLLPLVFSYWAWRPLVPAYTATATTLLILVGFFLSPPRYRAVHWGAEPRFRGRD